MLPRPACKSIVQMVSAPGTSGTFVTGLRIQRREIAMTKLAIAVLAARGARLLLPPPTEEAICDVHNQTHILKDGSRVAAFMKDKPIATHAFEGCETTCDHIRRGLEKGGKEMLGRRVKRGDQLVWEWITFEQALERSNNLGQALRVLGLKPGDDTRVGIFARNSPEWTMAEMALHAFSNVSVPLYDSVSKGDLIFIANWTQLPLVVCDTEARARLLVDCKPEIPHLKHIVIVDQPSADLLDYANRSLVTMHTWAEMLEMGSHERLEHVKPHPDTIATITFTSGTTGKPKGVVLTHRNLSADTTCGFEIARQTPADTIISYLPLAHIYQRLVELIAFANGSRVGYFRGDITQLIDDARSLQPTFFPMVPRVMNKIHKSVMMEVKKSPVKHLILRMALAWKFFEYKNLVFRADSWVDRLLLKKVRDILGGRVRFITVASAPPSEESVRFFRAALGCPVVVGYGQTENCGAATMSIYADHSEGHVGVPIPCNAVKLVDVPQLGYEANRNGGEVLIRGANLTRGYFKDAEATKNLFTDDGYIKTGDIGRWRPDGQLEIVDRMKSIFKLSHGKFVAPEHLENVYVHSDFISQIYVHGDTRKSALVAVVVPDPVFLQSFADSKYALKDVKFEDLCHDDRLRADVVEDLRKVAKNYDGGALMGYERIADVYLSTTVFSVDEGLLTPTQKNRRPQLAEFFRRHIDAMYERLEEKH